MPNETEEPQSRGVTRKISVDVFHQIGHANCWVKLRIELQI